MTGNHFLGSEQFVTIISEKYNVSRVEGFLNCLIWSIPPVYAIINVRWSGSVFPYLNQVPVHRLLFSFIACVMQIAIARAGSKYAKFKVQV
jgi:hypothetical protein